MRFPSALVLAACVALVGWLPAQNLVKNGDFAAATIAPWTASGFAVKPGLVAFDVNGSGSSRCYAANPGGQNGPPFLPHKLEQPIMWLPVDYELTFDIAEVASLLAISLRLARVDVFVGSQQVAGFGFTASRLRRTLQRRRICARFKPAKLGLQPLRFEFSFQGIARPTSPRLYVDNVELHRARNPQFCIRGDRILGQKVAFDVTGSPSAPFLVLLSPTLLPKPIKVPGISGEFALGLQVLIPFLSGALDRGGAFSLQLTIPNLRGLNGVKLYWQALQVATGGPSLGWHSQQAFYL